MATFLSQIAKITDTLYLSSFVGATEHNLTKFNISCVITVCKEVPKVDSKNIESIKLEVVDRPTESLARYFDFTADKINELANSKKSVLVHCVAGISRSATIVLAYLMKHLKMSLRDAHALVKSKRPFIRPNLGFWKQLVDYEYSLFGTNSVKVIPSTIGFIPDIYESEVRSMQWAKSNPALAGTLAAANTITFTTNNTNANTQNPHHANQPTRRIPNNTHHLAGLEKSHPKQPIEPIVGNAIPKFSNYQNSIQVSESANSTMAKLNKSHYTTTYRSSYQKP